MPFPNFAPSVLAAALAAALALGPWNPSAAAEREIFSVEARQWAAEPAGSFSVDDIVSESFDFERDIGLTSDDALEGRLVFRPSRSTLVRVGFLPEIALSGDKVLSRSFTFLNTSFAFDERVATSFDIEYARFGFAWQFTTRDGRFRIGPIVEGKGFRADLVLRAPDISPPITETETFEVAFGTAGLIADVRISDRFEIFGEASEVVTGDEGDVSETELGIRFLPTPKLAVVAGVRTLEFEFKGSRERFILELDGTFLGLAVRF